MTWLHEHGFVGCYEDYLSLPLGVLEDCRLVMNAEAIERQRKAARGR